jgi:hypothetical protein
MRNPYGIEAPPARPSGDAARWVDVWAWIIGFGLLLAAPCVPDQAPRGAARAGSAAASVSGRPGAAPRPP